MGRVIGFGDFPRAWEGPVALEFNLVSKHSNAARYHCDLEERVFDFYAPLSMLPESGGTPSRILVVLSTSQGPLRSIGFDLGGIASRTSSEIAEFHFKEAMTNVFKYRFGYFNLYVPKEVFADEGDLPASIFLKIFLPDEQ